MDFKIIHQYSKIVRLFVAVFFLVLHFKVIAQQANCVTETVFMVNIHPKPIPAFSFLANDLNASFANTSNHATSYAWDFGDPASGTANSSDEASPAHVFSAPGTYTVTLTATNNCGSVSTTVEVQASCPTVAVSVAADGPTALCPGASVTLSATQGFQEYQWLLDGSPLAIANNPELEAVLPGEYTVVATDAAGCTGAAQSVTVSQLPLPEPSFAAAANALEATFTNTSTNAASYTWDFGDPASGTANSSDEVNPAHVFSTPGTFTVTLTTTNGCGSVSTTVEVQASCPAISVSAAADGPTALCPGASVALTATQGFQGYQWLLDGSPLAAATNADLDAVLPGEYTVVATDAAGCTGAAQSVTVSQLPLPEPSFAAAANALDASFANTSTNAASYTWDFGDPASGTANSSDEVNPAHVFSAPGVYTVTLTATNGCGSVSTTVEVQASCPAIAVSAAADGPTALCPGASVTLSATQGFQEYQWLLDGSPLAAATNADLDAVLPGEYTVVATDAAGCTGAAQGVTISQLPLPEPSFAAAANAFEATFTNTSMNATSYAWDFGDPTSGTANFSNEAGPAHIFSTPGTFTITLTATNGCGSVSTTVEVVIECVPPTVSIEASGALQFCSGGAVTLQVAANSFSTYQWFLNDVPMVSGISSTILVTAPGNYKVSVTDGFGCSNFSNELEVEIWPLPIASVVSSVGDAVCEGAPFVLTGDGGGNYQWVVPDGATIGGGNIQIQSANLSNDGSYYLTVTDGNGCTSTAQFELTVHPLPIVSMTGLATSYTDQDPPINLVGTPAGGSFSGNGVTGNQFDPSQAGVGQHLISYVFTDANDCTGMDTAWVNVTLFSATTTLEGINFIQVFPNPNSGDFELRVVVSSNKTMYFSLVNALGQTVANQRKDFSVGESVVHFRNNELTSGVYFLNVNDGKRYTSLKVVVAD